MWMRANVHFIKFTTTAPRNLLRAKGSQFGFEIDELFFEVLFGF